MGRNAPLDPELKSLGVVGAQRAGQLRWLILTIALLLADQASKAWIVANFQLYETRVLLPVLNLSYWRNTGAAFSFLADAQGWQRWLFTALAAGASVGLIIWLTRLPRTARLLAASIAMILSGALGNLIDRVRFGYVNDFVQVHWANHFFPAFNVADAAITVGAILLLLDAWLGSRHKGG